MSILIKRYPNRKLYDTTKKQYITIDGIGALVRQGEEIKVVDNVTGKDLTAVVLSQVILENEKKRTGLLPRAVLAGLIQSGNTAFETMRRAVFDARYVASRDELLELSKQVDALSAKLDELIAKKNGE